MVSVNTLIVACDGSPHAARAAEYAAYLANATGARIHLVHAFPSTPLELIGLPGASPHMVGVERFDEKTFRSLWDQAAKEAFRVGKAAMGETANDAVTVKLSGDPAEEILEYASKQENPMIIIGPRGLGRVREALLGSVSQRVLHGARCPVVLVRH
ncbi:MAG: universal stress protein [Ectothiorhodospiraceae bacterium]|nr:universal stress protein [Ectothiorhodospiraceae bacterium]